MTERGWWGSDTAITLLQAAVDNVPDQDALVDPPDRESIDGVPPRRFTFAQVSAEVERMGALLRAHGLQRDDIVVAQLPNIAEQIIIYLAVMRIGGIVSPVPMQYGKHELRTIIEATSPRAFLALSQLKGRPFLEPRRDVFPEGTLIGALGVDVPKGVLDLSTEAADEEALAEHARQNALWSPDANDVNTLCWTSGTTGQPKGVPRHHNHWIAQSLNTAQSGTIDDGAAMLNPFPFVNMASFGGFFYLWLMRQGKLVLHHPFDLPTFLRQLTDEQINYTVAAPTVLSRLLKSSELDGFDVSHLKLIASGSAPLAPSMVRGFAERYGIEVANAFGSNEGVSLVTSADAVPDPAKRAQYFPRFGVEEVRWEDPMSRRLRTKLVDPGTGAEVTEPGVPGELLYWGPTVFDGYWKSPEANAQVFDENGFFHSGDLLEIAEDDPRFYRIVGRTKDIIVRGGMKLSPEELDALIAEDPRVAEGAVVGYPDEDLGERVCAVVVPAPGQTLTLQELNSFLTEAGLAKFKLPERLLIVEELPRNPLGKLVRTELHTWVQGHSQEVSR